MIERFARSRAFLLAGVAAMAVCSGAGMASAAPAPAPSDPPGADGLAPRDVYIEADSLVDDRDNKLITATGSVEARYQGRTLRTDKLVYNTESGTAHATGHAVIVNADGTTEYADEVELDDQLRAGVATAFAARLQDNVTMAAGAAIRRTETVNQLNNAIYTVCDICKKDGSSKTPTWSVQASRIIQDSEHHVVYYRNAIIRVLGVPVFYTPVFWHPDPGSERRSGFLSPKFNYSRRRGLTYEQPYLWAISPSSDLVVSPQFATDVKPFVNLDYRKRFWSGQIDVRGGYTYEKLFDANGKFGDRTSRSYILANGRFDPNDKWAWGFGLERASDPGLFTRYRVSDVVSQRGPFVADPQRLISQIYALRQDSSTFLSVSAVSFQSLRVQQINRQYVTYDAPDSFPFVAPLIEARFDPQYKVMGGRLRVIGSAVVLSRDQDVSKVTPLGAQLNQAVDTRRASANADWRLTKTFANGLRVEPFAVARGDLYSIDNPLAANRLRTVGRTQATVGANISMPFIRQQGGASFMLEPLAQLAVSPRDRLNNEVPNEDSLAFDFDSTNLFSLNRFPGYDRFEGGARANLGGRASATWGRGGEASLLVGRVFRTKPDSAFSYQTGLGGTTSDWVTAATLTPMAGLSLFSRSRLDSETFKLRRQEAGLNLNIKRISSYARYFYNDRDANGVKTESVQYGGTAFVTEHWGVGVNQSRDLQAKVLPITQYTLIYQDNCIRIDFLYTRDQTFNRTIAPSSSFSIRLNLATLGGTRR
jgi:LPS-assembly protein